jgi:hypothetical protein
MRGVLRHSRKWYATPPPSAGQAIDTAVDINEIGRLTTSFATNGATPSPPKIDAGDEDVVPLSRAPA